MTNITTKFEVRELHKHLQEGIQKCVTTITTNNWCNLTSVSEIFPEVPDNKVLKFWLCKKLEGTSGETVLPDFIRNPVTQ